MASTFKNAGLDVGTSDNSSNNLYTAPGAGSAVIHALYISNKSKINYLIFHLNIFLKYHLYHLMLQFDMFSLNVQNS